MEVTAGMELDVFLTAKIHVVSGMVIGALFEVAIFMITGPTAYGIVVH